jgi:enolase
VLYETYLNNNSACVNVTYPVSLGISEVLSKIYNQPLYKSLQKTLDIEPANQNLEHPDLFISMLQGGEQVGCKGKVYKFLLIVPGALKASEKANIISKVVEEVKQQICSTKLGAAAL